MPASQILEEQIIHVKRGRSNSFGFEPLWNAYFDFYLDARYFEHPLLELQDVTFHLFLRRNLNDRNKKWKMPTLRQIGKKFQISNHKIYPMLDRLAKAHLLNKESGVRTGVPNERNDYILSDPIPTLSEFLAVAKEGLFRFPLRSDYAEKLSIDDDTEEAEACSHLGHMDVPIPATPDVLIRDTHKQTSFKQTLEKQIDPLWKKVLDDFKLQMESKTFKMFLEDTDLGSIEEGVAVINITNAYAKDWIEARLGQKIARALDVSSVRCVVMTEA